MSHIDDAHQFPVLTGNHARNATRCLIGNNMSGLSAFAELKYVRSSFFDQFQRTKYGSWIDGHWVNDMSKPVKRYDSTAEGLESTPVVGSQDQYCTFCGTLARPIQAGLRPSVPEHARYYTTTGYFCDCVHAEKWIKLQEEITDLKSKHRAEMNLLIAQLPRESHVIESLAKLDYNARKAVIKMGKTTAV